LGNQVFTLEGKFAHVRNIEHSSGIPNGMVFLGDTAILYGHFPAPKAGKSGFEFYTHLI
jgi:hypothetical protein